jgi:hypothetical protein
MRQLSICDRIASELAKVRREKRKAEGLARRHLPWWKEQIRRLPASGSKQVITNKDWWWPWTRPGNHHYTEALGRLLGEGYSVSPRNVIDPRRYPGTKRVTEVRAV